MRSKVRTLSPTLMPENEGRTWEGSFFVPLSKSISLRGLAIRHQTKLMRLFSHHTSEISIIQQCASRRSINAFFLPLAYKLRSGVVCPCGPDNDGRTKGGKVAED
jgi:hypothetical protein